MARSFDLLANGLDRMIEVFRPERAVARAHARMTMDHVRKYEAAEMGRRTSGWKAGSGSSSAEVAPSLERVRNRARQMVRDNEYAKKAVITLATKIVGTGITVIPEMKAERDRWNGWCEGECDADGQLDFFGLQRLAALTWKESGECLVRRRWRRTTDGLAVPLQLQLLEPDHLDHAKTGIGTNGNIIIMGVEFDALGRRVGFWLYPEHPGEVALPRGLRQSERVDASEVIHLYRKDRISQVRGIPELAVSLMRLRDTDGYEEAEAVRKKIESCFSVIISTDDPHVTAGTLEAGKPGSPPVEKVSPGMIKYVRNADSIQFGTPAAVGGYGEYIDSQLHAIATGSLVTFHQLTGNTRNSSYTSHRAAMREFYDLIDQEQWLTFIPMFVRPVRRWFREAAQLAGQKVGTKPDRITTPRKQLVDPLKDTSADKEDIRGGLATLSEKLRERGYDPETVFAEMAAERKTLAELGITLDTDATVTDLKLPPSDVLRLPQE
jgi:lambda family phage portal protein